MSSYPTSPAFKTMSIKPINKVRGTPAESGKFRGSSLDEETLFRITVKHFLVTDAQATTLNSFYTTNKSADNTIVPIDGNTYDCWFEQDYTYEEVSATYQNATVTLFANRQ